MSVLVVRGTVRTDQAVLLVGTGYPCSEAKATDTADGVSAGARGSAVAVQVGDNQRMAGPLRFDLEVPPRHPQDGCHTGLT